MENAFVSDRSGIGLLGIAPTLCTLGTGGNGRTGGAAAEVGFMADLVICDVGTGAGLEPFVELDDFEFSPGVDAGEHVIFFNVTGGAEDSLTVPGAGAEAGSFGNAGRETPFFTPEGRDGNLLEIPEEGSFCDFDRDDFRGTGGTNAFE